MGEKRHVYCSYPSWGGGGDEGARKAPETRATCHSHREEHIAPKGHRKGARVGPERP